MLYQPINLLAKNSKLLFHHIPKTAGSTLRYRFETLFGEEFVCKAETQHELADLGKQRALSPFRFFAGHFSYSVIEQHLSDVTWITFLREPNERVVSQYYNHINPERVPEHWKQRIDSRADWKDYVTQAEGVSLAEWLQLENKLANSISCNRQTQAFIPNSVRREVSDWSVYREDLVAMAKENILQRFTFVGIQEFFDLSVALLESCLNILPLQDSTSTIENVNAEKQFGERYALDEETSELIKRRNAMDWEIYSWAKARFLLHATDTIRAQHLASQLESRQIPRQDTQQAERPLTRLPMQDISAFDISGFHQLEGEGASAFRWTGACEEALIIVPVDQFAANEEINCRLEFVNYADKSVLQDIQVRTESATALDCQVKQNILGSRGSIEFRIPVARDRTRELIGLRTSTIDESRFTGVKGRRLGLAVCAVELS